MRKQALSARTKKTTGKAKEAIGILSGNKKMEREGSLQRAEGTVQEGFDKARRSLGKALKELGASISR